MALYPCAVGPHRFVGKANRAYVAILDGAQRWEHKPRLCAQHLEPLMDLFDAVDGFIDPDDDDVHDPQPCLFCHQDMSEGGSHSVFMTVYRAGEPRADYFAPVHPACRPQAQDAIRGL